MGNSGAARIGSLACCEAWFRCLVVCRRLLRALLRDPPAESSLPGCTACWQSYDTTSPRALARAASQASVLSPAAALYSASRRRLDEPFGDEAHLPVGGNGHARRHLPGRPAHDHWLAHE